MTTASSRSSTRLDDGAPQVKTPNLIVYSDSKENFNSFDSNVGNGGSSDSNGSPLKNIAVPTQPQLTKPKAILFCILISMCGFIFGWDVGTIGGITNMQSFKDTFGTINVDGHMALPPMLIGVVISIFNIGCAVGGLTLAKFGDMYGRRIGIFIAISVYILGVLIQIITPSNSSGKWYQFFIGRIFTGLGVGSTAVLAPMFIGEIAPLSLRGAMIVLYQLVMTLGILAGCVVNFICVRAFSSESTAHAEWQIPVGLSFLWAILIMCGTYFSPESPVYLEKKKRDLIKRSNETFNSEDNVVNSSEKFNWKESFIGKPRLGFRLMIGCLAMIFQQTSGINYFFYYGTSLFNKVGLDDAYVTAIILAAVNFVATFGGIYLVEKLGRKNLLLLGSFGGFISMLIYASVGSFAFDAHAAGGVMIFFTALFIIFFAIALGPVTFVLVSELYPDRVRTFSMAIATSLNWLSNFLIGLLTPTITNQIGYKFGFVFAGFLLASTFFVYFIVPETKGLTRDEVDEIYTK